ncbi:MAG: acetylxylan esterase [Candidatus Lokiarchaeota archaeon]|nr:acetylxylan esterase [Candidatus Lokiarchaeota archaeon]
MKIEHWNDKEIKQACSFTELCNKIYEKLDWEEDFDLSYLQNPNDFVEWQSTLRKKFIKLIKIPDRKRKEECIVIAESTSKNIHSFKKYETEMIYIKSWFETLIPAIICIPKLERADDLPAFICLHGHLMRKENLVGLRKNLIYSGTWAKDLAELGCITITADQWGFGERGHARKSVKKNYDHLERKYALNMLILGHTISGLRIYDTMQQVDYLLSREDVDSSKIGVAGLSMGGTIASYTAAIDIRISMAIVAGFCSTFKSSILEKQHCTDNYVPKILKYGELGKILSLVAPRPLFFINGVKDPIFPIESAIHTYNELRKIYELLGKTENLGIDVTPYGHKWKGNKVYEFVKKKWLDVSFLSN